MCFDDLGCGNHTGYVVDQVVDQFVVFGTGSSAELILFGIPVHAVGLDDAVGLEVR